MKRSDAICIKLRELEQYGVQISKLYVDKDTYLDLQMELAALRRYEVAPQKLNAKPKLVLAGRKIFKTR